MYALATMLESGPWIPRLSLEQALPMVAVNCTLTCSRPGQIGLSVGPEPKTAFRDVADRRALGGQDNCPTQSDPHPKSRGEGTEVQRREVTCFRGPPPSPQDKEELGHKPGGQVPWPVPSTTTLYSLS